MTENEYELLERIREPSDIRNYTNAELEELCCEIRKKLIETVSTNGGHLASNLGTVELTVALHRSFNSPDDKIVWDVGHQAYTHKLLTGRYDKFGTIRTKGGLSGFVRPDESVHDSFYEGHAGTSVSQASGIASANMIKGNKNYAVAVIGDGSFGNGMVYEAMNHAGAAGGRLIVILNDNEMSISENVGAVARRLAVIRSRPEYYRFKANTEKALKRIPLVGNALSNFIFKIKNTLKSIIYRSSYFEDMGFRYIGPIDGHDITTLCDAMNSAKLYSRPVVVHVNTVKGKGYDFAENYPEKYHGISKFDIVTGEPKASAETYSSVFADSLVSFASKDKRICAVTAAMSIGTGLERFFNEFPKRSFDVGIAEEHAVTYCSGLSSGGMIPVFAVYSTFMQRCIDQLIHDGALQRLKMIIAVDRAGFVGEDGETHQGIFDVPLVMSIPNTTVYSPATYDDLKWSLYNSLYRDSNLVLIRYPRGSAPEEKLFECEPAEFFVTGDEDAEAAIVTYGRLSFEASKAYKELAAEGKSIKLIKINRIKPIPESVFDYMLNCGHVFFFEESMTDGGVGNLLADRLLTLKFKGEFFNTGVPDTFVAHAGVDSILDEFGLNSEKMIELIESKLL